jgi:hypothetical protein
MAVMEIMGGDMMEVLIRPHKDNHTAQQQRFFHALCKLFADEVGESPDAIKQAAKKEAFGSQIVKVGDIEVEVMKPSSLAKRDEYSALIETLYRQAAFCGVVLPPARWSE